MQDLVWVLLTGCCCWEQAVQELRCWRSPGAVLAAAGAVLPHLPHPKAHLPPIVIPTRQTEKHGLSKQWPGKQLAGVYTELLSQHCTQQVGSALRNTWG